MYSWVAMKLIPRFICCQPDPRHFNLLSLGSVGWFHDDDEEEDPLQYIFRKRLYWFACCCGVHALLACHQTIRKCSYQRVCMEK